MKKLIAWMLAVCLMLGMMPGAMADEETIPEELPEQTEVKQEEKEDPAPAEPPKEEKADPAPAEPTKEEKETDNQPKEPVVSEPASEPANTEEQQPSDAPDQGKDDVVPDTEVSEPAGSDKTDDTDAPDEKQEVPQEQEQLEDNPAFRAPVVVNGIPGPGVVQDLKVTDPTSNTLKLTWNSPASGADGYEMTLSKNQDFSSPVIRETTNAYYDITGLACGVVYYYRVRAYLLDGSVKVWGPYKTLSFKTSPSAPATLVATQLTVNSIQLDWTDVPDATGYVVEYNDSTLTTITTHSILTYTHKGVVPTDPMVYKVYAYVSTKDGKILSETPATVTVTDYAIPAPQNLIATSAGNDSVKLAWDKVEGISKYNVWKDSGDGFALIATATTNTYTDSGLLFGKEYRYYVVAYMNDSYISDPSDTVIGTAVGLPPQNVKAVSAGSDSIKITWSKVTNANGYLVEGADSKTGPWSELYDGSELTYTETGLSVGDARFYKVTAYVNISGNKAYGPSSDPVGAIVKPGKPVLEVENVDYNKQDVIWDDLGAGVKYEFSFSTSSSFSGAGIRNTTNTYYNVSGTTTGKVYYYRVRGYIESGTDKIYGPYSDTVSKKCTPAVPATVTAAAGTGNTANITWSAANGATSYNVYGKKDGGSWTKLGSTTAPKTWYVAKNLAVGSSYYFAVTAVRSSAESDKGESNEVIIDINNFVPTDFTDTAVSATSVKVSWKEMSGISSFEVHGWSDEDSTYSLEKTVTTNSITLTGLKTGYEYQIEVRSKATVNGEVQYSPWSATYYVLPKQLGPTGFSLTMGHTAYAVSVDWTASSGVDGYIIEWAHYLEGPWTELVTLGDAKAKHYGDYAIDSGLLGKKYYYRICSYIDAPGGRQTSAWTGPASVLITMPSPTLKATPKNKGRIDLEWNDVEADEYLVYMSTKSTSGYSLIATVTGTSYSKTGVKFGTVYYFKVQGRKNVSGSTMTGRMSSVVSAEPKTVAPTITSCTPNGSSVLVKWSAAAGATKYNLYYKEDGGSWKLAVSTDKLQYRVRNLSPETKYFFKVAGTAVGNGRTVEGLFSEETSSTTTTTTVGNVTGMKAAPNGLTGTKLSWNKVTDAAGYEVQFASYYVSDGSRGPWYAKATVTTNSASITGLIKNKTYWFRVRAFVKEGSYKSYGAWSAPFTGYSAPKSPTDLKAATIKSNYVKLTWTAASGADGYLVQYKKSSDATYTDAATVLGTTSYTITGLSSATNYDFRVVSFGTEADTRRLYGWGAVITKIKTK